MIWYWGSAGKRRGELALTERQRAGVMTVRLDSHPNWPLKLLVGGVDFDQVGKRVQIGSYLPGCLAGHQATVHANTMDCGSVMHSG